MRSFHVDQVYVASDGEPCKLSLDVKTISGSAALKAADEYFREFGYRVVESAKATGNWPLPPDHPNAGLADPVRPS